MLYPLSYGGEDEETGYRCPSEVAVEISAW
jgi:hypothetical protein